MRLPAIVLVFVGLAVTALGLFEGGSSFFAWNGRHLVLERSLGAAPVAGAWSAGQPVVAPLVPDPERRYTVSVQVVFDRASAAEVEGMARVESRMPLVVRVKEPSGGVVAESFGWLDPNERPNVLYGQAARASSRGPQAELVVERLVGPFGGSSVEPLSVEVDLGPDRVGGTRVLERRLVVYDDRIPPTVWRALAAAGAGALAFLVGVGLLGLAWWRSRGVPRPRTKRHGALERGVV